MEIILVPFTDPDDHGCQVWINPHRVTSVRDMAAGPKVALRKGKTTAIQLGKDCVYVYEPAEVVIATLRQYHTPCEHEPIGVLGDLGEERTR